MPLRQDQHAAASTVVAFLMAGVIFVGSVGAILVVSRDAGDDPGSSAASTAGLSMQAQGLADLLVDSTGYALDGGQTIDWTTGTSADHMLRLGLRDDGTGLMDYDKFQNLRRAGYTANPSNGRVDYQEARESLGITGTDLDFHIRAFPSLESVRSILACKDPDDPLINPCRDRNLRVTYVGDAIAVATDDDGAVDPDEGLVVEDATCAVRADGKAYRVSTTLTNGGTTTVQFVGIFKVDLNPSAVDVYEDRTRTFLVPAGDDATLSVDVPYKAGRTCNAGAGAVTLEVYDTNVRLGDAHAFSLGGSAATSAVARDLYLNPGATNYHKGEAVVIQFDGDLPKKGNDPSATLELSIAKPDGTVVHSETISVDHKKRSVTVAADRFTDDATTDFVATLTYVSYGGTSIGTVVSDNVLVLPVGTDPEGYLPSNDATVSYEYTDSTPLEVSYLEELVQRFCPYYYPSDADSPMDASFQADDYGTRCAHKSALPALSPAQPGDVFLDVGKQLLDLGDRLMDRSAADSDACSQGAKGAPRYDIADVLVVGSNVDHNQMNKAKADICEWVHGGGTLLVFGSPESKLQWMQSIFHTGEQSGSGGLTTPDASHPILTRPDQLAYGGYEDYDRTWDFTGQVGQAQEDEDQTNNLFTQVVELGGEPTLAVSDPGAFGEGNLIIATWTPYDIFGTGPNSGTSNYEGRILINNMLMLSYRDLFLDYGPSIPDGARQATAAQRVVEIQHPEFDQPITLTVFVYVF